MIKRIYDQLLSLYGLQGWWPISGKYNPGDYSYPKTSNHKFEICLGAILTQNTAWSNVEKALVNLRKINAIDPEKIMKLNDNQLSNEIKPAGYFNQKAKKVKEFTKFFIKLEKRTPSREELLDIWGVGPETADSMLLYAYKMPTFVIDAYTRRILLNLNMIDEKADYEDIKQLFEKNLKNDVKIYQEYHALIVEHAKRHYSKKPYGTNCPLLELKNIKN